MLVQMMIIVIIVGAASYIAAIGTAKEAAQAISHLNYRLLCLSVLAFLVAMTFASRGLLDFSSSFCPR
jgi:hypothetical protein